mmetsp:Transcript_19034/g.60882  ORF Transcript_19034/g.60882 Transcript_19034/m.60882 type:complete len:261 (-) Transcript_19034:145-927(-)
MQLRVRSSSLQWQLLLLLSLNLRWLLALLENRAEYSDATPLSLSVARHTLALQFGTSTGQGRVQPRVLHIGLSAWCGKVDSKTLRVSMRARCGKLRLALDRVLTIERGKLRKVRGPLSVRRLQRHRGGNLVQIGGKLTIRIDPNKLGVVEEVFRQEEFEGTGPVRGAQLRCLRLKPPRRPEFVGRGHLGRTGFSGRVQRARTFRVEVDGAVRDVSAVGAALRSARWAGLLVGILHHGLGQIAEQARPARAVQLVRTGPCR